MADTSQPVAREPIRLTAAAAVSAAELRQLANGRPGYYRGSYGIALGSSASFWTSGQATVPKVTGIVLLDGGPVFWDRSERKVTYRAIGDRDFPVGTVVGDAASADETCTVNFDLPPAYLIDSRVDAFHSIPVGTQVVGGFGYPVRLGGSHLLQLDSQNEAQKIDLFSLAKFSKDSNPIIEIGLRVLSVGSGTTPDFNIGIADATHATNFDSLTQRLAVHLDGNDTSNFLGSTDGTTTVALTDTTTDVTAGYEASVREEWWLDLRNPADPQIYRNGALMLGASVFNVSASASEFRLIAHLEKTVSTDTFSVAVDWLRVRTAEQ